MSTSRSSTPATSGTEGGEELLRLRRRLVHLPVARHERAPARRRRSRRRIHERLHAGQCPALQEFHGGAPTGGYVGEAALQAKGADGRHGVAAAGDRHGDAAGDGLADGARAGRELRDLEQAHRPVPVDRARAAQLVHELGRGLRADVEGHLVGGDAVGAHDARRRAGDRLARHDDVGRDDEPAARRAGFREDLARDGDLVAGSLGRADLEALGGEEGVGHGAADQHRVGDREHVPDEADLVRDLEAAQDDDERPRRVAQQAAEDLELLGHQQAGHGGQVVRDSLRGGVRAVSRAEGVVDVDVAERRQLLGEPGVVAGLLRVEAKVLQQEHVAGPERGRRLRGRGADAVVRGRDRAAEQLREARRHGRHAQPVDDLPLGPAEVGHEHDRAALVLQVGDRGQGGADARVVDDAAAFERHVEVDAHERALARERVVGERALHGGVSLPGLVCSVRGPAARGRRAGTSSPTRCRTRTRP